MVEFEPVSHIQAERGRVFAGDDRNQYLHVGYFLTWYLSVELALTQLLAIAAGARDARIFDVLVSGMDARVKCERLRAISQLNLQLGRNLSDRLTFFERRMVKTRNRLSHNSLVVPEGSEKIYFVSISQFPKSAYGTQSAALDEAPHMPLLDLFEQGYWLNHFSDDLAALPDPQPQSRILEIEKPRSPLPQAFYQALRRQEQRATSGKPPQTPQPPDPSEGTQ